MRGLLRKMLGIQTWKLVLVNPDAVDPKNIRNAMRDMPVLIFYTQRIDDIKIIDTGLVAKRKKENGQ